jgi:hypothetical protein
MLFVEWGEEGMTVTDARELDSGGLLRLKNELRRLVLADLRKQGLIVGRRRVRAAAA